MPKRIHLSEEDIIKDRLAYLGTLAGGLAHEIRSPLNSIHINVELLERAGCRLDDKGRELFQKRIGRIKEEVANLQKTLSEFLQFARPPGMHRVATQIRDFLYDMAEFLAPELKREDIKLKIECSEHAYPVLVDRGQIRQVVQNLIFNSRDAIKSGGGGRIVLRSREDESCIQIIVEDDGPGIEEEHKPCIFDAFFTTKERGTGLGLSIARRIVIEHGGSLFFESPLKRGRGAAFTIRLPKEKLLTHAVEKSEMYP